MDGLKPKQKEILEFLGKENKAFFETKIAFAICSNSYYTKKYLNELIELGLIKKMGKKYILVTNPENIEGEE